MESEKKPSRVTMDVIICGLCLFITLLLREYRPEVGDTVMWTFSIPLGLAALFFGFRAMNPPEDS